MNIGYITIDKFRLSEMCVKALSKINSSGYNVLFKKSLYKKIKMVQDCADTFGVKNEIMVDIELFSQITVLCGD